MPQKLSRLVSTADDLKAKILIGLAHIEKVRSQGKDVSHWEGIVEDLKIDLIRVNHQIENYHPEDITGKKKFL